MSRAKPVRREASPAGAKSENVVEAVRRQYEKLSQGQKRIAEYIVDNPEAVAFATVDQMAFELGTNPSTIVRFAYRLGLKGFPDLQERTRQVVRKRLSAAGEVGNEQSILSHLGGSIFASSFGQDLQNISRTIANLNVEHLNAACEMIAKARRVFIAGTFGSYGVCYYLALALDRIQGKTVLWNGDDSMMLSQSLDMSSADCLIAFTAAPYSTFTHRAVVLAKEAGARVIAVTDTPIAGVAQVADIIITAPSAGVDSQKSLVASLTVANALINGVARGNRSRAFERNERLKQLMSRWGISETKGEDENQH